MNWILTIVTFLPLVGVLAILLVNPPRRGRTRRSRSSRWLPRPTFLGTLLILFRFDSANPGLQLVDRVDWIPSWGISYFMGWMVSAF